MLVIWTLVTYWTEISGFQCSPVKRWHWYSFSRVVCGHLKEAVSVYGAPAHRKRFKVLYKSKDAVQNELKISGWSEVKENIKVGKSDMTVNIKSTESILAHDLIHGAHAATVILSQRWFCPCGHLKVLDIWIVTLGEGCTAQWIMIWPKMSVVSRLRKPAL